MERAYAQAIFEVAKKGMEPRSIATRVNEILSERGHMALLPKILHALKHEGKRTARQHEVVLHVAKEAHGRSAQKEAGATPTRVEIDPSLIGGWVLTTPDSRIDASFRKQLLDLYRKITH